MRQPGGALELIRLRLAGKVPAPHVVIADLDCVDRANRAYGVFVLRAGPGEWDMRCLVGLEVVVWCWTDDLLGLVESVALARPSGLMVMTRDDIKQFPKLMEAA